MNVKNNECKIMNVKKNIITLKFKKGSICVKIFYKYIFIYGMYVFYALLTIS